MMLRRIFLAANALLVAWSVVGSVGCYPDRRGCPDGVSSGGGCLSLNEFDCSDGVDADEDGLVDCADADCKLDAGCPVTPPEVCDNLVDDDEDGRIDCDDDECSSRDFDGTLRFSGCDCPITYRPDSWLDECGADGGACYDGLRSGMMTEHSGCVPLSLVEFRLHLQGSGNLGICATEPCDFAIDPSYLSPAADPVQTLDGITFDADGNAHCGSSSDYFACDAVFEIQDPDVFMIQIVHGMDSLFFCAALVPSDGNSNFVCTDSVSGGSFQVGFEAILK